MRSSRYPSLPWDSSRGTENQAALAPPPWAAPKAPLRNDLPMCRRRGRDGLVTGEAGVIGTIGLSGTPLPSLPVARSSLHVSNRHNEDTLWLVTVENGVGESREESPACVEPGRPAIRRFDDQPKRSFEFLPKARRDARISFRVPRRSFLAFGNRARVQFKGFHDDRSPPRGCDAGPLPTGSASPPPRRPRPGVAGPPQPTPVRHLRRPTRGRRGYQVARRLPRHVQ